MRITKYGIGGYDPSKPNNNVIEEYDDGRPDYVPESASPATIRVALKRLFGVTNATLDATVAAVIAGLPTDDARDEAETMWVYSVSIRRDHPLVAAVGQALNLTSDQVDDVFRVAATI